MGSWEKHGSAPQVTMSDPAKQDPECLQLTSEVTLVLLTPLGKSAARRWLWTAGQSRAQAKGLYSEDRASWSSQL